MDFVEKNFAIVQKQSVCSVRTLRVIRVWKQNSDENPTTRKYGRGLWKVASMRKYRHKFHIPLMDHTASSTQLAAHWLTVTGLSLLCIVSSSILSQRRLLYTRSLSRKTICACGCNVLVNIEIGMQIDSKLLYLTSPIFIYSTIMTISILNAILVNAVFKGALLNVIQHQHRDLWFGTRECIMNDISCHEFWIICIATATSVKYGSPKSFFSFKACLVLSFNKVLTTNMLQVKFTFCQQGTYSFFRGLCIRRICHLLKMWGISLIGISVSYLSSIYSFYRWTIGTHARK